MTNNPKVTLFMVEGAPHHYIPLATDYRLEAYLDGNSAPLKGYLRRPRPWYLHRARR